MSRCYKISTYECVIDVAKENQLKKMDMKNPSKEGFFIRQERFLNYIRILRPAVIGNEKVDLGERVTFVKTV